MQQFSATMDKTAKGITLLTTIVLIIPFITIGQYVAGTHYWLMLLGPVLIIAGLIACFLLRPKSYTLAPDELRINRQGNDVVIPLKEIQTIELIDNKEHGNGIRTFGSGGFFGYFGRFVFKKIGQVNMYATDRSRMLLITPTAGALQLTKPAVISPDDTDRFLRTFKAIRNQRATR